MAACLGLAACATRENPALDQARSQVSAVAQDQTVVREAPLEVQRAQHSLIAAESAWGGSADEAEVTSLAYVATQRAAIARETANARVAQEQIKNAEAERTKVLLSARTQEVERLQKELQGLQSRQTDRGTVAQATTPPAGIENAALAGSARASKLIGSRVYKGDTSIGQIED
jgi:Domain of unknown function (DUF4398)